MPVEIRQEGGQPVIVHRSDEGEEQTFTPDELESVLQKARAAENLDEAPVTVTIDGEEVQMTVKELKDLASKGKAADKRFQEASQMRKEAEDAIRLRSVISQIQRMTPDTFDPAPFREFGRLAGLDPAVVEDFIDGIQSGRITPGAAAGALTGGTAGAGGQSGESTSDEDLLLTEEDLHPSVRQRLKRIEELERQLQAERQEKAIQEVRQELRNDLTKDPVLGKVIRGKGADSPLAKRLEDLAFKELRDMVAFEGRRYGPELRQAAIQKVRQLVSDLGTRPSTGGDMDQSGGTEHQRALESDLLSSLGGAPGPNEGPDVEKPIKRVPPTDERYGRNLLADFARRVRKRGGKVSPELLAEMRGERL